MKKEEEEEEEEEEKKVRILVRKDLTEPNICSRDGQFWERKPHDLI